MHFILNAHMHRSWLSSSSTRINYTTYLIFRVAKIPVKADPYKTHPVTSRDGGFFLPTLRPGRGPKMEVRPAPGTGSGAARRRSKLRAKSLLGHLLPPLADTSRLQSLLEPPQDSIRDWGCGTKSPCQAFRGWGEDYVSGNRPWMGSPPRPGPLRCHPNLIYLKHKYICTKKFIVHLELYIIFLIKT